MLAAFVFAQRSYATTSYVRERLDNCYNVNSLVSIDPQRNIVSLYLKPNVGYNCHKLPAGVCATIKFESQDSLITYITDFSFADTRLIEFTCVSGCAFLPTVQKADVVISSARYETYFTPGASTKTRSDFSDCFTEAVLVKVFDSQVCYQGYYNGVCSTTGYTQTTTTLEVVFADESLLLDPAASRTMTGDVLLACFATTSAYLMMAQKMPLRFDFRELYLVNANVSIQITESTTNYEFTVAEDLFDPMNLEMRPDALRVLVYQKPDFDAFISASLATCAKVTYFLDVSLQGAETVQVFFTLPFGYFLGDDYFISCANLTNQNTCNYRFKKILTAPRIERGFVHLVFRDQAENLLFQTREQFRYITTTCFTQISFYGTDQGVEALYDLFDTPCRYQAGQVFKFKVGVFADKLAHATNAYEVLFENTHIAAERLVLVGYNGTYKNAVGSRLNESYGAILLVLALTMDEDGNISEDLIDCAVAVRERIYLTSQRDYVAYASIVMALTTVLCLVVISAVALIRTFCTLGKNKKKIEINNNLDEL